MDADVLTKQFLGFFMVKPWPQIVQFRVKLDPKQFLAKGSVVDIETTGLDSATDDVITIGILKGQSATVHQLTMPTYPQFNSYAHERTIYNAPAPRYAYNSQFESDFLHVKHGWQDLTQYAHRELWNPDSNPYVRLHLNDCTHSVFREPNIVGRDVPPIWQEWLKTKKPLTLSSITLHCLADLLRTRQLMKE